MWWAHRRARKNLDVVVHEGGDHMGAVREADVGEGVVDVHFAGGGVIRQKAVTLDANLEPLGFALLGARDDDAARLGLANGAEERAAEVRRGSVGGGGCDGPGGLGGGGGVAGAPPGRHGGATGGVAT